MHEGPEREQRYISALSLTLALEGMGGQRHVPAALFLRRTPGMNTQWIGDWVGLRTLRDGYGKYRSKCVRVFHI